MVKAVARCGCGRRELHLLLKQGEAPPQVPCDRACEEQARRARLADAFGVADPERHAPYFERHRSVTYSPALIKLAKEDPVFIEKVEAEFKAILADGSAKRRVLPAMPHARRALIHEYASEGWGFSSSSTGHEPNRAITIYKTSASGAPTQLLTLAAVLSGNGAAPPAGGGGGPRGHHGHPPQEAPPELCLRLVEVAPGVDVRGYLKLWQDHIRVTPQDGGRSALVVFDRPSALRDCSDHLGGGVRGAFRVDRSFNPAAGPAPPGAAAQPRRATAAPKAGAPRGSSAGGGGGGGAGGSWQTVAGAHAAALPSYARAPAADDPWNEERRYHSGVAGASSRAAALRQLVVVDDWEQAEADAEPAAPPPRAPLAGIAGGNRWAALEEHDA